MRIFEIILLSVNLLALLLSFRRVSKVVWSGVTWINLLALLSHGLVEGFRYQMAFSYIFVVLLVVHAFAKASGKFSKVRIPKALKGVTISLVFGLLTLTAFLAYALPVFTLPNLTGDYAVGIKYFALVDENRSDPFLDKFAQKRALMIKVYYPAKRDDSKPFSLYFHASTALIQAWAAFYQMPTFMFDHFKLIKTHAKDNLALSDEQPSYPVVLFSNGAGTTMEVETSQSEDLASHGYIVVDIDHPYVSAATVFPDRTVTAQAATTNFDTPEPAAPITQIMADDDKFVIKNLVEMNAGRIDPAFKGKLNIDALGVIGHSVGGAVAYNMAINDSRVKAAIDLDGAVYITPKNARAIAPFLMLANDKYHVQAIEHRENLMEKFDSTPESQQVMRDVYGSKKAYEAQYNKAQQNMIGLADMLKASGNLYTIAGSDHMKFTDIGLFIGSQWLRELLQIEGKTDPARCLEITQALTVAFFDQHLKGQTADGLTSLIKTYPELKKVDLN
ncbi:carboxylic ester hydrolase [soil metagenome]